MRNIQQHHQLQNFLGRMEQYEALNQRWYSIRHLIMKIRNNQPQLEKVPLRSPENVQFERFGYRFEPDFHEQRHQRQYEDFQLETQVQFLHSQRYAPKGRAGKPQRCQRSPFFNFFSCFSFFYTNMRNSFPRYSTSIFDFSPSCFFPIKIKKICFLLLLMICFLWIDWKSSVGPETHEEHIRPAFLPFFGRILYVQAQQVDQGAPRLAHPPNMVHMDKRYVVLEDNPKKVPSISLSSNSGSGFTSSE